MITNSMDPKGFSIRIETITSGNSGTEVTQLSLKDLLKNIEQVITRYYMADGHQQIALSIQACDQTFEMEESVVDLTDISPVIRSNPDDYTRQHWIETLTIGNGTSEIRNVKQTTKPSGNYSARNPVLTCNSRSQDRIQTTWK